MFYKRILQNTNQDQFRVEKVIKRKDDKAYVKWKGYINSLNNWIDKKRYRYMAWTIFLNDIFVVRTK